MAAGDQKHIIEQVETHIRKGGGSYADWFIGLSSDPIIPIIEVSRHGRAQNHTFTYVETKSSTVAKAVADHFINQCGVDGRPKPDSDAGCRALYLYKKTEHPTAADKQFPNKFIHWVCNKLFRVSPRDNTRVDRRLYA